MKDFIYNENLFVVLYYGVNAFLFISMNRHWST